ncbi:MAG: hypothetical protein ABSH08_04740 [Tepidisphaeraceae bacterium]
MSRPFLWGKLTAKLCALQRLVVEQQRLRLMLDCPSVEDENPVR